VLPREKGNLDSFKVVRIKVEKHDDYTKLGNKIIQTLGEKPFRSLLDRGKQLERLFDWYMERDFILVIVISSAHLINSKTIYDLKRMREFSSEPFPKSSPAFILLGNPDQLQGLMEEHVGIQMRSSNLPAPKLRLVKF